MSTKHGWPSARHASGSETAEEPGSTGRGRAARSWSRKSSTSSPRSTRSGSRRLQRSTAFPSASKLPTCRSSKPGSSGCQEPSASPHCGRTQPSGGEVSLLAAGERAQAFALLAGGRGSRRGGRAGPGSLASASFSGELKLHVAVKLSRSRLRSRLGLSPALRELGPSVLPSNRDAPSVLLQQALEQRAHARPGVCATLAGRRARSCRGRRGSCSSRSARTSIGTPFIGERHEHLGAGAASGRGDRALHLCDELGLLGIAARGPAAV